MINAKQVSVHMAALAMPVTIILYSLAFHRNSFLANYIITLACFVILIYVVSFFLKRRLIIALRSIVLIFGITYVLLELCTYFLLGFGIIRTDMQFYFKGIQATDIKAVCYDTIAGFRGVPGRVRFLSIDNGKFEIDQVRRINEQGWFSEREYSYQKHRKKH
jgi:hypothetical protein